MAGAGNLSRAQLKVGLLLLLDLKGRALDADVEAWCAWWSIISSGSMLLSGETGEIASQEHESPLGPSVNTIYTLLIHHGYHSSERRFVRQCKRAVTPSDRAAPSDPAVHTHNLELRKRVGCVSLVCLPQDD
eukprot:1194215-Prorocentrum_minimum.AAC.2